MTGKLAIEQIEFYISVGTALITVVSVLVWAVFNGLGMHEEDSNVLAKYDRLKKNALFASVIGVSIFGIVKVTALFFGYVF